MHTLTKPKHALGYTLTQIYGAPTAVTEWKGFFEARAIFGDQLWIREGETADAALSALLAARATQL